MCGAETTADLFQMPKGERIEAWTQTSAQVGVFDCLKQAKLNFQKSFKREKLIKFYKVVDITNKKVCV